MTNTHEAWHEQNKHTGDDHVIGDSDLEEALTERATERSTGNIIAYHDKLHLVDRVASATKTTRARIIDLFEQGQNQKINELHSQTFEKAA